jgi:hypothetical protein
MTRHVALKLSYAVLKPKHAVTPTLTALTSRLGFGGWRPN